MIRLCPNKKGCDYYTEFIDMASQEIPNYCGYYCCFKCGKEYHKSASCYNEKFVETFAEK